MLIKTNTWSGTTAPFSSIPPVLFQNVCNGIYTADPQG